LSPPLVGRFVRTGGTYNNGTGHNGTKRALQTKQVTERQNSVSPIKKASSQQKTAHAQSLHLQIQNKNRTKM
jgi:hypothetical protein